MYKIVVIVGRYAVTLSEIHATEIHAKTDNFAELKTALLSIYGIICHMSSLIRQSWHFARHFDLVLLQLVDILNTQFKQRESSWHSSAPTPELFTKKFCKIRFVITEYLGRDCMFTWKSELFKFKLLNLLNDICYFNKICSICGLILLCKFYKFGQKSHTIPEI